jgi:CRISPR-associated protein Csh1
MIYSLRQKLFDFVYRNQTTITSNDLVKIILFRIEKEIRNKSDNLESYRETLNLFFNRNLLLQTSVSENILEQVKLIKNMITSGKFEEFKIQDDEVWAYFAGQLAYYLVSLSKSKDKNYGLLEPFTNKSTTKLVKITINEMYDRYKHEISLDNKRFNVIASQILAYKIDRSFIDLKIPFYIGVFDDNVIDSKKDARDDE